ncbi:MAG: hypothetical protein OXG46_13405 [Chloroflexi bacterium]|nr:hypothetical protein [Chloroflexota bacterium]MCY3937104.1 hypothetical protein [Chloroflexota bacterium]
MSVLHSKRPMLLAVVLLATLAIAPAALAHEGREVGEIDFVVGFAEEPALEGQPNAVFLRVTEKGGQDMSDGHADDSHEDAHDAQIAAEGHMSVSISLEQDALTGANLTIVTDGFIFTAENVNKPHVSGEGHAHVYVNGIKVGRLYGPSIHLDKMKAGMNEVRVTLNANTHEEYTWNGQPVTATATIHVEKGGEGYGEPEGMSMAGDEGGHVVAVPVEGLESSLQVEVTHLASNSSTTLQLTPKFGEPGSYEAVLIPTAPGKYRFRFFGEIMGQPVDEAFESGEGTFDEVVAAADVQFPLKVASLRELEGVTRSAQAAAVSAGDDASLASTLAIVGIVVGAIGTVAGAAGLAAAVRTRSRG